MTAQLDFPVLGRQTVADRADLMALLRDTKTAVRVCGTASASLRLPAPSLPVVLVSLAPMQRITRLDPFDLTCSVEPGLERAALDGELSRHRLVLPCPGTGTIGGLLARAEHQPLAPGAASPRSVVLGLEGVLADGTAFKVGARVVKSVAGFDVHRAFVGSRGRLLVGTEIHLKLRPAARASLAFVQGPCDRERALAWFRDLRLLPMPPQVLVLQRVGDGFSVAGRVDGAPAHVRALQARFALAAAEREPDFGLSCGASSEVVDGTVQPSALPRLLATLPADAPLQVSGTGQFQVVLPPAASDRLLASLTALPGGTGEIRCGSADRRGRSTPLDENAARLQAAVRAALDPRGVLQ